MNIPEEAISGDHSSSNEDKSAAFKLQGVNSEKEAGRESKINGVLSSDATKTGSILESSGAVPSSSDVMDPYATLPVLKTNKPSYTFPKNEWPRHTVMAICPNCHRKDYTIMKREITSITVAVGMLEFVYGTVRVFAPFRAPPCQKAVHYCFYCDYVVGEASEFE